jgi:N-acetylmuramoyl-L-alanine amidase
MLRLGELQTGPKDGVEEAMASGSIVIDPGHGGSVEVGGSSGNNATSPSGVLEKNMTLRMGLLVRDALRELASAGSHNIKVLLTRDTDKNLGLRDRAGVAFVNKADIFLSIHFNASEQHKSPRS